MVLLNILMLTCIIVIIVDISGFISSIKYGVGKFLGIQNYENIRLKPLDCAFCLSWWTNLIYIIVTGNLQIYYILFILLCSVMTPVIKDLIWNLRDLISKIINML